MIIPEFKTNKQTTKDLNEPQQTHLVFCRVSERQDPFQVAQYTSLAHDEIFPPVSEAKYVKKKLLFVVFANKLSTIPLL